MTLTHTDAKDGGRGVSVEFSLYRLFRRIDGTDPLQSPNSCYDTRRVANHRVVVGEDR